MHGAAESGVGLNTAGFSPREYRDVSIEHCHQNLGHTVEPQAAGDFRLQRICLGTAGEIGQKQIRPLVHQQLFCGCGQPERPQPITIVSPQEFFSFKRFEDFFLVCACTGQAAYLGRGELTGQSGERQQQICQRVLGRYLLTASSHIDTTSFHCFLPWVRITSVFFIPAQGGKIPCRTRLC